MKDIVVGDKKALIQDARSHIYYIIVYYSMINYSIVHYII